MAESSHSNRTVATDTLRIYGFSFDFPVTNKLEFDPKFTREEGSVAIKSPSKLVVFVSWGDLRKVVNKLPTPEEHSKFSMERAARVARGRLTILEQRETTTNGHLGAYNHFKVETSGMPLGGRGQSQEMESLHLHCRNSSRYYIIYVSLAPDRTKDSGRDDALWTVINTFKCH
jgi:hypothetical protein